MSSLYIKADIEESLVFAAVYTLHAPCEVRRSQKQTEAKSNVKTTRATWYNSKNFGKVHEPLGNTREKTATRKVIYNQKLIVEISGTYEEGWLGKFILTRCVKRRRKQQVT